MQFLFFDTSALVKRYVSEIGSAWVKTISAPAPTAIVFLARITIVEFTSAVIRRQKVGTLSAAGAATILADFRSDLNQQHNLVQITASLLGQAASLAEAHVLRAYDAVQLAALVELDHQRQKQTAPPGLTLISADGELNAAATAKGFSVDDPNNHP